ncbi:MAG: PEP-CTERM sorting domain-containing protein [Pirellulales bacterium]
MLITHSRSRSLRLAASVAFGTLLFLACIATGVSAQVLVGSPYITGFGGWESTYVPVETQVGNLPAWGVLLTPDPLSGQRFLMETSDGRAKDGLTTAGVADGQFLPYMMIDTAVTTPANYNITYNLATRDDDGFGVVFGYQDNDNYFRASFRQQASGNLGFQQGTSVQKVVNGTITQLSNTLAGFVPTSDGTPFEAKVVVNGSNWDIQVNNVSILNGNDGDLQPGHYGVHSWAQHSVNSNNPSYGTTVRPITVASTTLNKTTDFADAVSSIPWRRLVMTNSFGETGLEGTVLQRHGNFAQDFTNGTIRDDSNSFFNAGGAPNVDFIGAAVVVDSAGSAAMDNYRFTTRVENRDNDGIGLLFRVADDNTFYRINWATEGPGTGTTRPPLGMSIQKYSNFTWSEVFRDDQLNPTFLPQDSVPFDLSIQAVGNQFKIDLINDPNGNAEAFSYDVITDAVDPILNGSVGFTNWGNGNGGNGAVYSAYNGDSDSLVSAISSFIDFGLTVNRTTNNVTLVNNAGGPVDIKGVTLLSSNGALTPASWQSIADNYDEAPGNGSVDPNDPWTEVTATEFDLSERENSGGNGGTLTAGETVNLGNIWKKSQLEDLVLKIELTDGNFVFGDVEYTGGPLGMSYSRSDLNTDGNVTPADWALFFPNMLADLSAMTGVQRALAGDVDLDGDNDVNDFVLFKTDFDAVNGAGSFDAMIAVPEPSTVALVLVGGILACGARLRRRANALALASAVVALGAMGNSARAVPLDFTTFGTENFPRSDSNNDPVTDFFPQAVWTVTPTTATHNQNSDASVLYSQQNVLGKRITGTVTPGTDDDILGFVLGFAPGDSAIGSSADYLLIDWKGASQTFDFFDFMGAGPEFHNLTPTGPMPVGLALSRVTGSPTNDELWQHLDLPENPDGGVTQLARGATLGSTAYNRAGGSHQFDIQYTANLITVSVDGVEQFSAAGNFPEGRFGLYTVAQGPPTSFNDYDISDATITGLSATVDRGDGTITLNNEFNTPIDFDFYQFSSASNSLDEDAWNSLSEQNFDPEGPGAHQRWQEAGGSNPGEIAEVFLGSGTPGSGSTLGANTSLPIGSAYNNSINGEDLVFRYRLATGELRNGFVEYIGAAPGGVTGDYNGDGTVNAADYTVWRNNLNGTAVLPNDSTPGTVTPADYNVWRANFGNSGSGSGSAVVPEPTSLALLTCVGLLLGVQRCSRRNV